MQRQEPQQHLGIKDVVMDKLLKERIKWGIVVAVGLAISFISSGKENHATQAASVSLKKMLFSQTEEDNTYRQPLNNERGCLSAIVRLKKTSNMVVKKMGIRPVRE